MTVQKLIDAINAKDEQEAIQLLNITHILYDVDLYQTHIRSTILHLACKNGFTDFLLQMIEKPGGHRLLKKDVNTQDNNGDTPLHFACENAKTRIIQLCIEHNADVRILNHRGRTPLHLACENGHKDVVDFLLTLPNILTIFDRSIDTPLHLACENKHTEVAISCISKGVNIFTKNTYGYTPLHIAYLTGNTMLAEFLIAKGANTHEVYHNGDTPLTTACKMQLKEMVEFLIAKGANVNEVYRNGDTLLHASCYMGHEEIAKLLILKNANVNAVNNDNQTPLHATCYGDLKSVAELLLDKGSKINAKDNNGNTPLHLACGGLEAGKLEILHGTTYPRRDIYNCADIAILLINRNADVNACNNYQETPMHSLYNLYDDDFQEDIDKITKLLIEKHANVNAQDSDGDTPLHIISSTCSCAMITCILANGANIHALNHAKKTPWDVVCKNSGDADIAKILIHHGLDIFSTNDNGDTLLHTACQYSSFNIAYLLIELGVDVNARNHHNQTPLHLVLNNNMTLQYQYQLLPCVQILVNKGANIHNKDNDGYTPLHVLCNKNHNLDDKSKQTIVQIAKLLIQKGANINRQDNITKETVLHGEHTMLNSKLIDLFIYEGIKINAENHLGQTALHKFFLHPFWSTDKKDVIRTLVKEGADIASPKLQDILAIKNLYQYQTCATEPNYTDQYFLAMQNKIASLTPSPLEMKQFILKNTHLQKIIFQNMNCQQALEMFNGDWKDFFTECKNKKIYITFCPEKLVSIYHNAFLYLVDWKNTQDSALLTKMHNILISDRPLKWKCMHNVLDDEHANIRNIRKNHLEHLLQQKSCDSYESALDLFLLNMNHDLWDEYHHRFKETQYFDNRQDYCAFIDRSECLYSHYKNKEQKNVYLGILNEQCIISPVEFTKDIEAVRLVYQLIAQEKHGIKVDFDECISKINSGCYTWQNSLTILLINGLITNENLIDRNVKKENEQKMVHHLSQISQLCIKHQFAEAHKIAVAENILDFYSMYRTSYLDYLIEVKSEKAIEVLLSDGNEDLWTEYHTRIEAIQAYDARENYCKVLMDSTDTPAQEHAGEKRMREHYEEALPNNKRTHIDLIEISNIVDET